MQDAILAGIFNDLGSGSNVDVTTIKKVNGKVEVIKEFNCIKPNEVSELRSQINRDVVTHIPRGATRTLALQSIWVAYEMIANHAFNCRRYPLFVRALPGSHRRERSYAHGSVDACDLLISSEEEGVGVFSGIRAMDN